MLAPRHAREGGNMGRKKMRDIQLAKMLVDRSFLTAPAEAPFRLASGRTSLFYFDCQFTTMYAEAMPLIGAAFLDRIVSAGTRPEAVGGLTRGADPIAQAVAMASLDRPPVISAFSVRKQRKDHGTSRWIEGCAKAGIRVAIVDDVITSGGSVIAAIDRCDEEQLVICQVVVLVDREEGGLAAIQERVPEVPVSSVFTKTQLDEVHGGLEVAAADLTLGSRASR
jgi:orotate phosphoribosyltransferase